MVEEVRREEETVLSTCLLCLLSFLVMRELYVCLIEGNFENV